MIFAIPTYIYVLSLAGLIAYGLFRVVSGDVPAAAIPPDQVPATGVTALSVLLILRAFASGSVALTGAEAVANGVPSMKQPETRNASATLILMALTFGSIFLGLTFLAQAIGVAPDQREQETLNSLVTRSLVGEGFPYYLVQLSTAVILALAANTGFTGFPRLAAVLANDRFMPRHFADRGERLAFSFGILVLAALASIVLVAFSGSVTALIPLYTIASSSRSRSRRPASCGDGCASARAAGRSRSSSTVSARWSPVSCWRSQPSRNSNTAHGWSSSSCRFSSCCCTASAPTTPPPRTRSSSRISERTYRSFRNRW